MEIVPLAECHLPKVQEIEAASSGAPWSERAFRNELDNPHGVFLVAVDRGGEVCGYGGMWLIVDEAHITNLAVAPDQRRRGVAKRLMRSLLTIARERGMVCSTLEVRTGNTAAIRLYEALGYAQVSVRKRYYPDNREDAAIMWLHSLD
jgi:ribosomal-protein-alanine N-acetyltransferase